MIRRHDRINAITKEERARRLGLLEEIIRTASVGALMVFECPKYGTGFWITSHEHQECTIVLDSGRVIEVYDTGCAWAPEVLVDEPDVLGVCEQTDVFDAGLVADAAERAGGRIGVVNGEGMSIGYLRRLREAIPNLELVDLSDDVEFAKSPKSPFEQELSLLSADMHQRVFSAVPAMMRAGRTVKDLTDEIRYLALQLGSSGEDMCLMAHVLDKDGVPCHEGDTAFPGERIGNEGMVSLLLETNGPGGYYQVIGRYFAFEEPSDSFKARYETAVSANRLVGELMKPGVSLREVADTVNQFIRDAGYYTDDCCYLHSLGYFLYEYPSIADYTFVKNEQVSEDTPLVEGMLSLAHPHVGYEEPKFTPRDDMVRCVDTYRVTASGSTRCNSLSQDIVMV
jgi:Xaa-Pro aminopeptidase